MLERINPTSTQAWFVLKKHFEEEMNRKQMKDLFAADPARFEQYSIATDELLFDYSKNIITDKTLQLLLQLANECGLEKAIKAQWEGKAINETENRAVLHTALRDFSATSIEVNGENILPEIRRVQQQMKTFCNALHSGEHKGYTGKKIKTIVNIGIGGSDLGPVMVTEALKPYWIKGMQVYFVSNVDGTHIAETLKKLNVEETLFLIASKTFTTQETMTNAHTARAWFLEKAVDQKHIATHFVALSTNEKAVNAFGIHSKNMFEFWDWVGGRYSLWSAIGLSIALYIGMDGFEDLLKGGFEMDEHFKTAPIEQNIPMMMGLLGVWYINFFNFSTHAILAYDQGLSKLAPYLQQADMESNGKFINRDGEHINFHTGPVIWGEVGTNGQHAFYQLLHQGTEIVPADFIMPIESQYALGKDGNEHHKILLSNFIAQTQSLMLGKTYNEARAEIEKQGYEGEDIESFIPQKTFEGNRPTSSILFKKLTPKTLGQIIAMYEHKIFTQGIIWNINSFDQWGVEYGKQIAKQVLPKLSEKTPTDNFDSSTNGLINYIKKYQ